MEQSYFNESYQLFDAALNSDSRLLINHVLKGFADVDLEYYSWLAEDWVAVLDAIAPALWEKNLKDWLKQLYRMVFEESSFTNFDKRLLVFRFVNNASWDDDPSDFGLCEGGLGWFPGGVPDRIKLAPFQSEQDLLLWKSSLDSHQDESTSSAHLE